VIASVSGKVSSVTLGTITIVVGGIGLLVNTTSRTASSIKIGESATLLTELIVREDSLTLYGFVEPMELEIFALLRSVNGVGPKSALSILSALSVEEIAEAVSNESDTVFKSVPGVGVKTAKLITLSLAGKLTWGTGSSSGKQRNPASVEALVSLGYSDKQAAQAVSHVFSPGFSDQKILKLALQYLASGTPK